MHPADSGIAETAAALRDGSLTCEALTRAHLDRIAERDPAIGAFVHVVRDEALVAARNADALLAAGDDRGRLHGIPFAVKDLIDVAGWPVRHGAKARADRVATGTAPVVRRLIAAGAVPLGVVASYDLGIVGPGEDGAYRQPRNPWDRTRVTGGSSSGSAAAVAAGLVRVALGTDTGGSVRSPSSYCGTVGLKPSYGSLPVAGVLPLAASLDHVGAVARSTADMELVWQVLSGRAPAPRSGIAGLRIGHARDWAVDGAADACLLARLDEAASGLSLLGARISIVDLPAYALMEAAAAVILHAEGFALYRDEMAAAGDGMGRMAIQSMAAGAGLDPADVAQARRAAAALRGAVDAVLVGVDVLLTPTTLTTAPPFAAFAAGTAIWTPMRTIPFNLTGHPALSVPMGFAGGLPLGLQLVGRHGDEATLLRVAAAFEAATDHGAQDPYLGAPS